MKNDATMPVNGLTSFHPADKTRMSIVHLYNLDEITWAGMMKSQGNNTALQGFLRDKHPACKVISKFSSAVQ